MASSPLSRTASSEWNTVPWPLGFEEAQEGLDAAHRGTHASTRVHAPPQEGRVFKVGQHLVSLLWQHQEKASLTKQR